MFPLKLRGTLLGLTLFATTFLLSSNMYSEKESFVANTSFGDIWVTTEGVTSIDDAKPMRSSALWNVRSVEGVAWAVPISRNRVRAIRRDGSFKNYILIGIDDASLIGAPQNISKGNLIDLRRPDSVIVNDPSFRLGEVFEMGEKRAQVVAFFEEDSEPLIYTTLSRAEFYTPRERRRLSFILVKALPETDPDALVKQIRKQTGLAAYTNSEFKKLTNTNLHF